jgi:hypothetical protein
MTEIRLATGQKAQLRGGRVEVVAETGKRYRLTVEHVDGGTMMATARDYADLLDFLRQAEQLRYELRSLSLEGDPAA